jgi:signal transduction histidine kinase
VIAAIVLAPPAFSASGVANGKKTLVSFWGKFRKIGPFSCEIGEGDKNISVTLPHTFIGLPPRTRVTLVADIEPRDEDSLLIKAFYSPLRVYVDDKLIYECGEPGSYPAFMRDPPTTIAICRLPRGARELRLEYLSPIGRDRLEAQNVLMGNDLELYTDLLIENLPSLIFSALFAFSGVMVIFLTIFLLRDLPRANILPWLGVFALFAGAWGFGECDFSLFLTPHPVLLHMMAFLGLFALPVPFLAYGIGILNPVHKAPLYTLLGVAGASLLGAVALQLTGTMDLSSMLPWFHFFIPFSFAAFSVCLLWEYHKTGSLTARRFAVSIFILTLFSVLEVINYRWRFVNILSLFFQTGLMLSTFSMGIVGGRYLRDVLEAAREKKKLEADMAVIRQGAEAQRERYAALMERESRISEFRHDLRHHIAVIRQYNADDDPDGLNSYLDKFALGIPQPSSSVCQNYAVNAVAQHYLSMASDEGVVTDVLMDVPKSVGRVHDIDLCVIAGNFLENALDACRMMKEGERYIRVRAKIKADTLAIAVENSFDGVKYEKKGVYLSRKRAARSCGIGISSVEAICKKYDGAIKFDVGENVWRSCALVDLTGHLEGERT